MSGLRGLSRNSGRSGRSKQRSRRLECEALDQRDLPTVVFNPVFGAETIFWRPNRQAITSPMASNATALENPTVYLIFWGSSWTSATASQYASDAKTTIQSPYLSGLKQYGSDGQATYGDYTIDNSTANDANRDAEIQYILDNKMTSWIKPSGIAPNPNGSNVGAAGYLQSPIYIVVCDNGDGNASNGGGLYTSKGTTYLTNGIMIDNGTIEDSFTDLFSHELVERISDGTGAGIGMNAPVNVSGEYSNAQIADNEPDGGRYTYRLNNSVLVQAYWSIHDQAFIVPDGQQQNTILDPLWKGTSFTNQSLLLQQGNLYEVYPWARTKVLIDTQVSSYARDSLGNVYDLTAGGTVKKYGGSGTSWTALTGTNTTAQQLLVCNGGLYMLAANTGDSNHVWKYSGSGFNWTQLTITGQQVSQIATFGKQLYMLSVDQVCVYSGSGTNWPTITGTNTTPYSLVATDTGLYMWAYNSGGNNTVWKYNGSGTSWAALTGTTTNVSSLLAADNVLYMIANNGQGNQVWQYSGTPLSWNAVTGTNTSVSQISTADGMLYMVAANPGGYDQVWQYSGSGIHWNALTDPGSMNVSYMWFSGDVLYMEAWTGNVLHKYKYGGAPYQWTQVS
jgi:hypothetical protein